tara:strand:- start:485 stop:1000 length:516 start_codon:yes stop_codon:yes gene_type:complete
MSLILLPFNNKTRLIFNSISKNIGLIGVDYLAYTIETESGSYYYSSNAIWQELYTGKNLAKKDPIHVRARGGTPYLRWDALPGGSPMLNIMELQCKICQIFDGFSIMSQSNHGVEIISLGTSHQPLDITRKILQNIETFKEIKDWMSQIAKDQCTLETTESFPEAALKRAG